MLLLYDNTEDDLREKNHPLHAEIMTWTRPQHALMPLNRYWVDTDNINSCIQFVRKTS